MLIPTGIPFVGLYMVGLAYFPMLVRGSDLDLFLVVWIVVSMVSVLAIIPGRSLLSIYVQAFRR